MNSNDVVEIIGYLLSSFASGYIVGFMFRVFYKALGFTK